MQVDSMFCNTGTMDALFVDVSEDAAVTSVITHIVATDADTGQNGRLHYEIVSGNEAGCFTLDEVTGKELFWACLLIHVV